MTYYYSNLESLKEAIIDGQFEKKITEDFEKLYLKYSESYSDYHFLARLDLDQSFVFNLIQVEVNGFLLNSDFLNNSGYMYSNNAFGICFDLHNSILKTKDLFITSCKERGRALC